MNADTKTKVKLKCGGLETVCVDLMSKKLLKFPKLPTHVKLGFMYMLSDMSTHSTFYPGYETLDYE